VFFDKRPEAKARSRRRRRTFLLSYVVAMAVATIVLRRRGYGIGGDTLVRCRQGHLYTTIWVPGASVKALRLGWWRFQWCPVGRHWSLVNPVRAADLSEEERIAAHEHKDVRIP
jgi:hypothetical protein